MLKNIIMQKWPEWGGVKALVDLFLARAILTMDSTVRFSGLPGVLILSL